MHKDICSCKFLLGIILKWFNEGTFRVRRPHCKWIEEGRPSRNDMLFTQKMSLCGELDSNIYGKCFLYITFCVRTIFFIHVENCLVLQWLIPWYNPYLQNTCKVCALQSSSDIFIHLSNNLKLITGSQLVRKYTI